MAAAEHHPRGRSAGAYADARGAEPGAVADGDEADPRTLCRRPPKPGSTNLLARRQLRCHRRIWRRPIRSRCFPMRIGLEAGEGARICCPMRDWCSTRSGRRTSCARTRSNARRRTRPMSPSNASAKTSRPAASAPASMRASMPATSRRDEAPLLVRSLLSAGLDTTVNGIGAAVYCLARFPDQLARLRSDPTLARNAFEEAVRFESPVQTFFRTTTREVEIGGPSNRRGREGPDVPRRRQPRSAALGKS